MAKKEDANNTEEQNKTATTPPAEAPATGKPATETPEAEAPEAEEESKSESGGLGGFLKGLDWNELASTASSIKDMFTDSDEKNKQSMQEVLTTLQAATADKAVLTDSFNALENLSFKDLIGKPMTAAIEAQAEAAKSTLDFVKQMCVTSADGSQQVAVVSFEFFKNGKKARINLPLLSLVNIPSLEIKSMTYKFTAKIDSHSSLIVTHGDSPVKSTSGSIGTPAPKDGEKMEEGKKDDGKKAEEKKVNFLLPIDNIVGKEFDENTEFMTVDSDKIPDGWMGLDIGEKTQKLFAETLKAAGTVVWNGPMGVSEWKNFAGGTSSVADAIAASGAISIIGGGDSAAAVEKLGYADKMTHVSTGGGASLEFLEGLELPGIACLEDK